MGVIERASRDAMVSYSKSIVRKLLRLERMDVYQLSIFIIVLGQLIYAVCAPSGTLTESGDYYVTRFIVEAVLPKKWQALGGNIVSYRNTLCHYYGSESCGHALSICNKQLDKIKELADYMLTLE